MGMLKRRGEVGRREGIGRDRKGEGEYMCKRGLSQETPYHTLSLSLSLNISNSSKYPSSFLLPTSQTRTERKPEAVIVKLGESPNGMGES